MFWLNERSQDISSYSPYSVAMHKGVGGIEARGMLVPESMNAAEVRQGA